jgi:hypothetical protein
MEEKELSGNESLQLIQQMILTAKAEQKDNGRGWIMWGWMLFLASILTFLNIRYHWFQSYFFWNLFGLFTLLMFAYGMIAKAFFKKKVTVRTYTRDLYEKLNIGFFISLMFIIVSMNVSMSPMLGFPLLINLYAFWILIYGSAVNFRPSIVGAYITWAIGLGSLFVGTIEMVMLMHGLAALCGYIIPGHIANREFNKLHSKDKAIASV